MLPCYLRLSLAPAYFDPNNRFNLHPNMLHVNTRQNKKTRQLQDGELPDDVDWVFVFRLDADGTVSRITSAMPGPRFEHNPDPSPALDSWELSTHMQERPRILEGDFSGKSCLGPLRLPECSQVRFQKVAVLRNGCFLDLGSGPGGLMLNIITPLRKFSKGGITLSDVLRQRYQDLYQRKMPPLIAKEAEDVYLSQKSDRVKLQRVRLMAEAFSCDNCPTFRMSSLSEIICNSKSKECGPLQLHDINPSTSCTRGNTKLFILSFFKLVSKVRPAFVLWDRNRNDTVNHEGIMLRLNQPDHNQCTVFNQCVIICMVPPQSWDVIQEIQTLGLELRICAYRPGDNRMSKNTFRFDYLPHQPSAADSNPGPGCKTSCAFCQMQRYNFQFDSLPLAKPRVQRRKHDDKSIPALATRQTPMEAENLRVWQENSPAPPEAEQSEVMDLSVRQPSSDCSAVPPPFKKRKIH